MPKFTNECRVSSATETVYGGSSGLKRVEEAFDSDFIFSLFPDRINQPVLDYHVDNISYVAWSNIRAVK